MAADMNTNEKKWITRDQKYLSDEIVCGYDRGGHRALLYSLGIEKEELKRPFIAVINSWNEIVPGCAPLKEVAASIKRGVLQAGGLPFEFCTIAVCDGLAQGHTGMNYSLPCREIIADSIEIMLKAHCFDGAVFIGSCDKITPGMFLAAVRVNIPSIFVQSGPMWHGRHKGEALSLPSLREYTGKYYAGAIDEKELDVIEHVTMPTLGSCAMMGTANAMANIAEAIGMALPMSSTTPPFFAEKHREARRAGVRIVDLVKNNIRPSDIINDKSIENALRVTCSTGSSTNIVLHMQAIAKEAKCSITLKEIDQISSSTPLIARVHPSGKTTFNMLHPAGGVPAIMQSLGGMLDRSQKTVSGLTIGEIADSAEWEDKEIIRPVDNPFEAEGGIRALWGSLAPEGAVVKRSGVAEPMRVHRGPAIVFEKMEDAVKSVQNGTIEKGSVLVIRNEGPLGGPGMREMQLITTLMVGTGLSDTTALVTDGRFSGATRGPCIGHITPEAVEGGPIRYVKNGDMIYIDLYKGVLDLEVSEEEMLKRRKEMVFEEKEHSGVLRSFVEMIKRSKA